MSEDKIRDAVMAWVESHRDGCTSQTCSEPANFLAYLCHCAGLRVNKIGELGQCLAEYERRCPDCQHLRN
jgi:hypothetical protein